jgi:hypothetical protein
MNHKYIFIFAITVFILLTITGPGIFLNDEWIVGQQLNQLSQGHQITYNEGKYGYYLNGTPNNYMISRMNILIYPITIPIISLPLELLFTLILLDSYTRFFILLIWISLGIYCCSKIDNVVGDISIILFTIISSLSLIFYSEFPINGNYIPNEIIAIVFMNILIMGIFSVVAFKLSELLFDDKNKQIVGWIASLSCTSLLFWSGTLKDHVLLSTILLLLCYCQIYYIKNDDKYIYLIYTYLLAGISLWIRPEVGIFVIITLLVFNFIYIKRNIIFTLNELVWIFMATLPMFLNNRIVTGSALKSPFLMTQSYNPSGSIINEITNASMIKFSYLSTQFNPIFIIRTFIAPSSGSIGLIVPLCLFFFALITMIKYKQKLSIEMKFVIMMGVGSILYYLIFALTTMQMDDGVVPDIRYFTPAYVLFTLFALSIIPYELNYKKIIRNIFLYLPIIMIIALLSISTLSIGENYQKFGILPEIISLLTLAIMIIVFINDKTSNPIPSMEKLIPIAIVTPLIWQFIVIFVYHSSKLISYPMFIPIMEYLYKFMFGV